MSGAAERVTKLGETELTAYRGDRGKLAYDHSQETGNPHGTTTADISDFSEALQAAIPAPRRVDAGKVYVVGENQQVAFRFPIVVEGVLRVDGILYEV